MSTGTATLYIPPIDPDEVTWSGLPLSPEEALATFDVDQVLTTDELNPQLSSKATPKTTVYAIADQVSDQTTFLSFSATDFSLLKPAVEAARATKDGYEIALIRKANEISTQAHVAVMKAVKTATSERDLEAIFISTSIKNGCRKQAYDSIVASGTAAATLHYIANDQPLAGKLNLLLDAGAELRLYASDITRTFPISGTFTPESRAIYSIVLTMQKECIALIKQGAVWDDIHTHAHRVLIAGFQQIGIFHASADPEAILTARTSVAFLPHGLGHYLGMDTHDCGGDPNYADPDPMFRYLRKRGPLPTGAVITVEPGCYFCRYIIEPYLKDEKHSVFIDESVLEKYWDVGGVRIEDNIVVTDEGHVNLTTTPKEIEEMEGLIHDRPW